MKEYRSVTPTVRLLNNTYDLDIVTSEYANIRWGVGLKGILTISSQYVANLPGLAYDYYGDQSYWRAILAFNGLQDPISDIQVGTILGLPDDSSLQGYLSRTVQSSSVTMTV
jgi:hypothetical protein